MGHFSAIHRYVASTQRKQNSTLSKTSASDLILIRFAKKIVAIYYERIKYYDEIHKVIQF